MIEEPPSTSQPSEEAQASWPAAEEASPDLQAHSPTPEDANGKRTWTIKNMPMPERTAATNSAKRQGLEMADWLSRVIREAIKAERAANRQPPVAVIPPIATSQTEEAPASSQAASLDDLQKMIEMAAALAASTGEPTPKSVSRVAFRAIRQRLSASMPRAKSRLPTPPPQDD
jgi:pyruvate/2-oxoglutarate dehydrogenase complex dihydrolipoamide acyltransferase (E2) component